MCHTKTLAKSLFIYVYLSASELLAAGGIRRSLLRSSDPEQGVADVAHLQDLQRAALRGSMRLACVRPFYRQTLYKKFVCVMKPIVFHHTDYEYDVLVYLYWTLSLKSWNIQHFSLPIQRNEISAVDCVQRHAAAARSDYNGGMGFDTCFDTLCCFAGC